MTKYKVANEFDGSRADVFLSRKTGYSRSSLEKLFDLKKVQLNSKTIKASNKLKNGDLVDVNDKLLTARPADIDIPVVYEDENVIVLDKPAGLLTHSKGALNSEATVASFIKNKLLDKSLTGNRAGVVHRLDRWTSGIIICAKTEAAQKWLQKQFSTRKVLKEYAAVVHGIPKEPQAKIDAPIERNSKRPNTFKVNPSGKSAQTMYRLKRTFRKNDEVFSLVELWPYTGRTHQIRVHVAYIGLPLVGDSIYGKDDGNMLLHAKSLTLVLPNGAKKEFKSPLPKYFRDFMRN